MLRLSRKVDYGLLILAKLARRPREYLPLEQIAGELGLPLRFSEQIAGSLKESGVLSSKEGKGGGYKLARTSSEISVLDVVGALEGEIALADCIKTGKCLAGSCGHRKIWEEAGKDLEKTLSFYKLSDLISNEQPT